MKVNSVNKANNNYESKTAQNNNAVHGNNPNFKGLLDVPGIVMTAVENGGFATSFLIQDMAGMTVPRCREGLYRGIDKEDRKNTKIKDMNFKEGAEVFIREALSGPVMMFSPMIALALGRKFIGRSTFTNSAMINRLGNKLKSVVSDLSIEGMDAIRGAAHENTAAIKKEFYKKNISDIAKSTTNAADKNAETAFVNDAVESFTRMDELEASLKGKARAEKKSIKDSIKDEKAKLIKMFNDFHKTNSSDLNMVNRVNYDGQVFSTSSFIDGMRGYAHDVLKGKEAADITEQYASTAKNKALINRALVNASAIAATIGSLSIVPKIYKLVNPVPPGALDEASIHGNKPAVAPQAQMNMVAARPVAPQMNVVAARPAVTPQAQMNVATAGTLQSNNATVGGQVAFKGKFDAIARHLEFNGNQFTPALMTGLAATALIPPRVRTALKRAPEDPTTKKKDRSEVGEVLARDITSTAAVTFGVPMLANAIIQSYEHASGFVLKRKPEKPMTTLRRTLDLLNPFSAHSYYGLKDLDQIYGNVNTTEKLGSFANFVDQNGGSLAKIFKTEPKTSSVFEEFEMNLKDLASAKDRKAANQTIMEKLADKESGFAEKMVEAIKHTKTVKMKDGTEKTVEVANKMLKRARSLNSMVSCAATFFLVPAFLGVILPRMVYGMTAKKQKELKAARNNTNQQPAVQQPVQQTPAPQQATVQPAQYAQNNGQAAQPKARLSSFEKAFSN